MRVKNKCKRITALVLSAGLTLSTNADDIHAGACSYHKSM